MTTTDDGEIVEKHHPHYDPRDADEGNAIANLPIVRPTHAQQQTPAQAKVDAIAALTATAYARASMLQLTPEESKALQADFPDEAFRSGAAGKDNLIYIEHAFLRDRLNNVLGLGQWSIVQRARWTEDVGANTRVYVEAMLLVRGCFVDEAIGDMTYYVSNAALNFGDAVEGAKTQALRRCAKTLGVGLQAWKKGFGEAWLARKHGGAKPAKPPEQPRIDQKAIAAIGRAKTIDQLTKLNDWASRNIPEDLQAQYGELLDRRKLEIESESAGPAQREPGEE